MTMNLNKYSFALISAIISAIVSLIAWIALPIIIAFDEYKQIVLSVLIIYQKAWLAMLISFTCAVISIVAIKRSFQKRAAHVITNIGQILTANIIQ